MGLIERKILELVEKDNPQNPMGYVRNIIKEYSYEKMAAQMSICKSCNLCDYYRARPVFHDESKILVITDYLKENKGNMNPFTEDEYNNIFKKTWEYFGQSEETFSYINSVSCTPIKDINGKIVNRMPSKEETENCRIFVNAFLDIVNPKGVLLLGPSSSGLFIEKPFTEVRGKIFNSGRYKVLSTYHPSHFDRLLKMGDEEDVEEAKSTFIDDVELLLKSTELIEGGD